MSGKTIHQFLISDHRNRFPGIMEAEVKFSLGRWATWLGSNLCRRCFQRSGKTSSVFKHLYHQTTIAQASLCVHRCYPVEREKGFPQTYCHKVGTAALSECSDTSRRSSFQPQVPMDPGQTMKNTPQHYADTTKLNSWHNNS